MSVKLHLLYYAQMLFLTQPLGTSSLFCLRKGESEPSFFQPHLKSCLGFVVLFPLFSFLFVFDRVKFNDETHFSPN